MTHTTTLHHTTMAVFLPNELYHTIGMYMVNTSDIQTFHTLLSNYDIDAISSLNNVVKTLHDYTDGGIKKQIINYNSNGEIQIVGFNWTKHILDAVRKNNDTHVLRFILETHDFESADKDLLEEAFVKYLDKLYQELAEIVLEYYPTLPTYVKNKCLGVRDFVFKFIDKKRMDMMEWFIKTFDLDLDEIMKDYEEKNEWIIMNCYKLHEHHQWLIDRYPRNKIKARPGFDKSWVYNGDGKEPVWVSYW